MAEKDLVQKTLESYNDVFADIVNTVLFDGTQVIAEDSLTDAQTFSHYKIENGDIHAQERDVAKYWKNGEIRLSLFGLENQTKQEKTMPIRIMNYDSASYRSQLLKKKHTPLYPVVTLVLYFGTERQWEKNVTLKEIVSIPEPLRNFVNDYRINVVNLAWLTDEQIALFKSDFKEVVLYLKAKRLGERYKGGTKKIKHIIEILDLFRVLSNDDSYSKIAPEIVQLANTQNGGVTMDMVMDVWRRETLAEGENLITSLFAKLFALGRDEDVKRATTDREYLKKLMEEYQK